MQTELGSTTCNNGFRRTLCAIAVVATIGLGASQYSKVEFFQDTSRRMSVLNLRQYTLPPGMQQSNEQRMSRQMEVGDNSIQHIVDCTSVARLDDQQDDGMYVQTTTETPFLMNIHDPTVDTSVSLAIEMDGVFEGHLVDGIMSALTEAGPSASFIDIGGNIGMYSLASVAKGHNVIAFEPFQINWRRICNTVNSNLGFESRLEVHKAAVVEEPKLVSFGDVSLSNPGHVVAQEAIGEIYQDMEEGVDYAWGVSLDSMQDSLPLDRPVVMKLDIEGGECRALQGGLEYLSKADLVYVQMEVMADAFEDCPQVQEVINLLVQKGLKPYFYHVPGSDVHKELDPENWQNWFDEPNFVIGDIVWKKETPQESSIEVDNDQHLVDCSMAHGRAVTAEDRGVYAHTTTDPPFLMNTHDPKVDQSVSLAIEMSGVFEQDLLLELAFALTVAGLESFFIDVGGNIGMYALTAAAMGHDVVAFEPFETNWRRICNTINANPGFEEHVQLYNAAVVDEPKLVSFGDVVMSNPGHVVAQKEVAGEIGPDMKEGRDYAWGVSLDSMQASLPLDRPIVMKLDIEGGECKALAGGLDYLAKADLFYLQMEVMSDSFENCPQVQDVIDVLARKGLSPFFYHVPGTSTSKPLDPHNWRSWLDEPDFVIGDIVWKKVVDWD